jgi:hypothetical protein
MPKCKKCGAQIVWVEMKSGKMMPCNAGIKYYKEWEPAGDMIVTIDGRLMKVHLMDLRDDGTPIGVPDGTGFIPHWATCPHSESFKAKKRMDGCAS